MTSPPLPAARVVAISQYEVGCPFCGVVVRRPAWSIAHMNLNQVYHCECGEKVNVLAEQDHE